MSKTIKLLTLMLCLAMLGCVFSIFAGCNTPQRPPNGDSDTQLHISTYNCNSLDERFSAAPFYTLHQAYDKGFLTKEDLLSIAYYYHKNSEYGMSFNRELMGENYAPIPQSEPDDELIVQIKQSIVDKLNKESASDDYKVDCVSISYYGTYSGGVAFVAVYSEDGTYAANMWDNEYVVDGIKFHYPCYTTLISVNSFILTNGLMFWTGND